MKLTCKKCTSKFRVKDVSEIVCSRKDCGLKYSLSKDTEVLLECSEFKLTECKTLAEWETPPLENVPMSSNDDDGLEFPGWGKWC